MAIIKCKMCGGDLNVAGDSQIAVCEYCGTQQTVPKQDNEKKTDAVRAGEPAAFCL